MLYDAYATYKSYNRVISIWIRVFYLIEKDEIVVDPFRFNPAIIKNDNSNSAVEFKQSNLYTVILSLLR